ncbi:hypothetical protein Tco_0309278 [Tanacetum coccineum]
MVTAMNIRRLLGYGGFVRGRSGLCERLRPLSVFVSCYLAGVTMSSFPLSAVDWILNDWLVPVLAEDTHVNIHFR